MRFLGGILCAVALCLAQPAAAGVQPMDTWLQLDPAEGSARTSYTATFNYSPQSAACPPTTEVEFTWDGVSVGTSALSAGVSPCRAKLTATPLAGHTAAGNHQVCGTFATHKGCAPFRIEAAASKSKPSPQYSTYTTYTTYTTTTTTYPRATATRPASDTRRPSSSRSPQALPPESQQGGVRTGPMVGAAAAILLAFGVRAIVWSRRREKYRS
jgi:hypothetical protein